MSESVIIIQTTKEFFWTRNANLKEFFGIFVVFRFRYAKAYGNIEL